MEKYDTLEAAVTQLSPTDKRRVYRVLSTANPSRQGDRYVLAVSPSAAALAIVGEHNIEVVSQKDKYQAALAALMAKGDEKK